MDSRTRGRALGHRKIILGSEANETGKCYPRSTIAGRPGAIHIG